MISAIYEVYCSSSNWKNLGCSKGSHRIWAIFLSWIETWTLTELWDLEHKPKINPRDVQQKFHPADSPQIWIDEDPDKAGGDQNMVQRTLALPQVLHPKYSNDGSESMIEGPAGDVPQAGWIGVVIRWEAFLDTKTWLNLKQQFFKVTDYAGAAGVFEFGYYESRLAAFCERSENRPPGCAFEGVIWCYMCCRVLVLCVGAK